MLFRALETYLQPSTSARTFPHLNNYLDTLNVRREMVKDRFDNAVGYESKFVRLLRKILGDADIPQLQKKSTDLDIYLDNLIFTHRDLDAIFDAVQTGLTFTDTIIAHNPKHTEEFLIPVQCMDPLSELPLDKGWSEWQKYKAVRLVDTDSLELTFNLYQDQIVYKKDFPTRAVVTIDTVALVLQYISFLEEDTSGMSQGEYLHRYVIVNLLEDLQNLWLGNVYEKLVSHANIESENKIDINKIMGDHYYGYVGVEYPTAIKELILQIRSVKKGVMTPAVFIKSLRTSETCVVSFLNNILDTTSIDDRKQNMWMEYLRDRRWLSLLYYTYTLQPSFAGTKSLFTALRRDLPILAYTRFWNNCHDPKTRQFIQDDVKTWLDRFK
jgi:hypothetical protein